ncbi:MAG: SOS response-associated peptidase [Crocinitomicaceae bacterium]|nr:SOS response-associated peptidase [Crocinitomicaceae bacterium]MCF8433044.1 SOS response-associated peptidase [Crocinitomicaceae bacterium]
MCYSNSSTSSNVQLAERYKKQVLNNLQAGPVFYAQGFTFPNWRIITADAEIQSMKWGLIPSWFKGVDSNEIASMTLNAKIETAHDKASFKHLIDSKRCIIPSTGFFEWKTIGKEKVPYFIYPNDDSVFSMAGIYDTWVHPSSGSIQNTFSMLTCTANPLMAEIHNTKKRMPVILSKDQEENWLQGNLNSEILELPFPDKFISAHQISKKIINNKQANVPEVLLPFENQVFVQGILF